MCFLLLFQIRDVNSKRDQQEEKKIKKSDFIVTENSSIAKAFLIFCVVMIEIFGGLWLYNHYKNVNDSSTESRY